MSDTSTQPDYENLSDEELMNVAVPETPAEPVVEPEQEEVSPAPVQDEPVVQDPPPAADPEDTTPPAADPEEEDDEDDDTDVADEDLGDAPAVKEPKDPVAPAVGSDDSAKDPKDPADPKDPKAAPTESAAATETPPDYEKLYKQMMAPFKANGREFAPSNPEEAVRLMQMGANYTKKMQALQPNMKLLRMLENNGLLEQEKLSYLIDLDKKDPKAIQKLLHEGKIDPLDIDLSEEPAYTPGAHAVSDEEMAFNEVLANVSETSTGQETLKTIRSQWDEQSRNAVYKEPVILSVINKQRENGIYDQITAEIDRMKVLGEIPANEPFLQSYKTVGDRLHQANLLKPKGSEEPAPAAAPPTPQPAQRTQQVVDTRTAAPKPTASNGDKARAISPAPRSKPAPAAQFDPLNMSDDEIMAMKNIPV